MVTGYSKNRKQKQGAGEIAKWMKFLPVQACGLEFKCQNQQEKESCTLKRFWGSLVSQLSLFGEPQDPVRDLVSKK